MVKKIMNTLSFKFHFSNLDLEFKRGNSPTKALFQRWSYENPTFGVILDQLYLCGLVREAVLIQSDVLKGCYEINTTASVFSAIALYFDFD